MFCETTKVCHKRVKVTAKLKSWTSMLFKLIPPKLKPSSNQHDLKRLRSEDTSGSSGSPSPASAPTALLSLCKLPLNLSGKYMSYRAPRGHHVGSSPRLAPLVASLALTRYAGGLQKPPPDLQSSGSLQQLQHLLLTASWAAVAWKRCSESSPSPQETDHSGTAGCRFAAQQNHLSPPPPPQKNRYYICASRALNRAAFLVSGAAGGGGMEWGSSISWEENASDGRVERLLSVENKDKMTGWVKKKNRKRNEEALRREHAL